MYKKTAGGRAFSYRAPLLWNKLPVSIKKADAVSTFKVRLKTFLLVSSTAAKVCVCTFTANLKCVFVSICIIYKFHFPGTDFMLQPRGAGAVLVSRAASNTLFGLLNCCTSPHLTGWALVLNNVAP